MYQITQAAIKLNRKIVLVGRSIDQSARVGRSLGLLPFSEDAFVDERESAKYPQSELVYIIAGCYGQEGSALDRLARNEHDSLILEENALVIFSADPNPPGVDVAVEKMMSNLTLAGAEVVYSKIQDNLHVSGHGTKGDLMTIASVVKPKFFIPLGGTITKMRAYTNMLTTLGFQKNQVFEMLEGQILELGSEYAKITGRIETKQVYIDSVNAQEVNPIVIRDRNQLSSEGVFVVVLPVNASDDLVLDKLELISRGFVYVKGSSELMDKSRKFIQKSVSKSLDRGKDWINMRRKLEADLQRFLHQETGRRPLVIVHSIKL